LVFIRFHRQRTAMQVQTLLQEQPPLRVVPPVVPPLGLASGNLMIPETQLHGNRPASTVLPLK
jgi:hypothetical protein